MEIRKANKEDLSRIAEIYVYNNRMNFFPIFNDVQYSFKELQVLSLIDEYFSKDEIMNELYVGVQDSIVLGFLQMHYTEICKLYVDSFFQGKHIGHHLICYAIKRFDANMLWALEKNARAIAFYENHGFQRTHEKKYEEGTLEYIIKLQRT